MFYKDNVGGVVTFHCKVCIVEYFTFEKLNLHVRESTLEKIVPQGLIRNTE